MSTPVSLSEFAAQLDYAAGQGAAKIASSVTASGNLQAEIGFIAPAVPGPALRSLLGSKNVSSRPSTATTATRVPQVADRMAADALQQGAQLLEGGRK